jgi:hypothetical protein
MGYDAAEQQYVVVFEGTHTNYQLVMEYYHGWPV